MPQDSLYKKFRIKFKQFLIQMYIIQTLFLHFRLNSYTIFTYFIRAEDFATPDIQRKPGIIESSFVTT